MSQTAAGAESSFEAFWIGGDGTPFTAACVGTVGAGGAWVVGDAAVVV